MRYPRALVLLFVALLALTLVACNSGGAQPTPVPPTNTPAPLIVTQIVPPPTPTPLPTLAPEISAAVGEWALRVTLDVTGWPFADRLSYFGAATFTVDERGAIEGSGSFSPTLDGGQCLGLALDDPLTFRVTGAVNPSRGVTNAEVRLQPDQRFLAEHFQVLCPDDAGGVREHRAPVLWPALAGLDLLVWPLTLDTGERATFEGDLSATSTGLEGTLAGEVQVSRR